MSSSVYICQTCYHLFITILLNIKNSKKSDLIIFGEKNDRISKNSQLISKLIKSNIFNNIENIDCSDLKNLKNYRRVLATISRIKKNNIIKEMSSYEEIYIFNDISSIGKVINRKKIKYSLLEDGRGCFDKKHYERIASQQNLLKRILKKILFGYSLMAESKNIKKIIVDNKNNVQLNKEIEEQSFNDLIKSLNKKERLKIAKIFLSENLNKKIKL